MTNKTSPILIVDDNPENIRVLGAALERNKYKMTIATKGDAAIKMAETNPFLFPSSRPKSHCI
jgi:CheY-like chemotaxis protein